MKRKIQRVLPVIVIGFLFTIYILLWYKQFSYFHYSGESFDLSDADLQAKAVGAAEKAFVIDEAFPEKIGRIVFWPTKYSDIVIENNGTETIALTVSDYEGSEIPSFAGPVTITAAGNLSFVADGRASYVLTAYGTQAEQAEQIRIRYDDHAYMMRWKKCVYALLGSVAAVTVLGAFFLAICETKAGRVLPWAAFGCGAVSGIGSIVLRLLRREDWCDTGLRFLAVFFFAIAIVSSAREEMQEKETDKKARTLLNTVLSAAIALFVHFLFLSAKSSSPLWHFTGTLDSGRRILGYLIVVVLFLIVFLVLENSRIADRMLPFLLKCFEERVAWYSVAAMVPVIGISHNDPKLLTLLFLAAVLICAKYSEQIRIPKIVWGFYYALITVWVSVNHCVINIWDTGRNGDVYHTGTLYHSLYYVANGLPFPGGLRQMYGHFALFYKIPLMLFGNNMRTVGVTTAVFSGIAVLCLLLFLHRSLKEDFSRLIGGAVVLNCFIINQLYLQTFPLRMFWPFVLLLYCTFLKKEITFAKRLGGYALCALALVWNMESGLVCAVAWMACVTALDSKGKEDLSGGKSLKDYLLRLLKEIPFVLLEILAAYLIVKGYNMLLSAPAERMAELLNWKKEMSTMAREEAGDTSNGKLLWSNAAWITIELLLLCSAGGWVHRLLVAKKEPAASDTGKLFLAVFSVGIFIYWMGRPEEYDSMAPYVGAMLVLLFEKALCGSREEKSMLCRYAYTTALFVTAFGIAGYLGHTGEKIRYTKENLTEKKIADYDAVSGYLQDFSEEVSEDAYAEAYGIGVIYMSLGRELTNDGLGWGNGTAELEEKVRGREWVLLNDANDTEIPAFREVKQIPFGNTVYTLYENESGK